MKLNSFIHRLGNSIGNGAGCPPAPFLLWPLKVQTPFVQSINSCLVISFSLLVPVFFQLSLYKTKINSTGAITYGAEADIKEPQAVRRDMLPSFQIIVEWYFQPISFAIFVISAPTDFWPPLFLSSGILSKNRPSFFDKSKHFLIHFWGNFQNIVFKDRNFVIFKIRFLIFYLINFTV